MSALVLDGVSVSRGRREVLTGVDLTVAPGEVVALLGPNGAGKSTLLEAAGGLLPTTAGTVTTQGRVATALQAPDLARRSVQANVELALSWWGVHGPERTARATDALAVMGAAHLASRPASALSGGERRRVHLARAVALRPDVLLLDEPFAGVDTATREELLHDASSALRAADAAVVVVVHDRSEAWALADRLVVLLDGAVAADGPPQHLLDHPPSALVAEFLGHTGRIRDGSGVLLARPTHVQLDPAGELTGTVTGRVPREDAVLLDLDVPGGHLQALAPHPGPVVGESVRLRLSGGTRFAD